MGGRVDEAGVVYWGGFHVGREVCGVDELRRWNIKEIGERRVPKGQ